MPSVSEQRSTILGFPICLPAVAVALVSLVGPAHAGVEFSFSDDPVWISGPTEYYEGLRAGDLDLDGDLDLVAATHVGPSHVYLNTGRMFAVAPAWSSPRARATSVALGDIDGNGYPDLVFGTYERNLLYLNRGGILGTEPDWIGPADSTVAVALVDVDADGDLDLVCGTRDRPKLFPNAGGMFSQTPAWFGDAPSRGGIALGDVDGEGGADLVVVAGTRLTVYYRGPGGFDSGSSSVDLPLQSFFPVLGDVDGDGDLDLLVSHRASGMAVYPNEGGRISAAPLWSTIFACGGTPVLGDLDGDGDLDVCDGRNVYVNEGVLSRDPDQVLLTDFSRLILADVDGDGDLDLMGSGVGNASVATLLNLAEPFPRLPQVWIDPGYSPDVLRLADLTGDEYPELVVGAFEGSRIYLNRGGDLTAETLWIGPEERTEHLALGDVDGDGDLDVAFANGFGSSTFYRNDLGTGGTMSRTWVDSSGRANSAVEVVDLDGDTDLDLVFGGPQSSLSAYYNQEGVFPSQPSILFGGPHSKLAVADLDADGLPDVLGGMYANNYILYRWDRNRYREAWRSEGSEDSWSMALADQDGDGDLDLFGGATTYANEGGIFGRYPSWNSGQEEVFDLAVLDLDADGDLDLINAEGSNARHFEKEAGAFIPGSWRSLVSVDLLAAGDIDQDGDFDLVGGRAPMYERALYQFMAPFLPPLKGDPSRPGNHLSDNDAFLKSVRVSSPSPNLYAISFDLVDVEGDSAWILPEYQYQGDPEWIHIVSGDGGLVGPLRSSPGGAPHEFLWDVSRLPFDDRDIVLRLKTISLSSHGYGACRVPSYLKPLRRLDVRRAEIRLSEDRLLFDTVTVGDTARAGVILTNVGNEPLRIADVELPSAEMWVEQPLPLMISPGSSTGLSVDFAPSREEAVIGTMSMVSNDPLSSRVELPVEAPVRPLTFSVANLYPGGEVTAGTEVLVSVILGELIRADSVAVGYRRGGEEDFRRLPLLRASESVRPPESPGSPAAGFTGIRLVLRDDHRPATSGSALNEQWFGSIPGEFATLAGLEFQVHVHKHPLVFSDELRRLRVRVSEYTLPIPSRALTYQMITVPLEVSGSILDVLQDDLGPLDATRWRLLSYDPGTSAYVEAGSEAGPLDFEPGRGYWLISRNAAPLDIQPRAGLSTPTDSAFVVKLEPGWNQVGSPFGFPVDWDDVLAASGVSPSDTVLESPRRWVAEGSGGRYEGVSGILSAFEGLWIKNNGGSPLSLRFPAREAPETGQVSPAARTTGSPGRVARHSPASGTDDGSGWAVRLLASCCGSGDADNLAGIAEGASRGRDRWDRSDPPLAPGSSLSLYFPYAEAGDALSADIRPAGPPGNPAGSSGEVWRFDVVKNFEVAQSADRVTLEFRGLDSVPADLQVQLHDRLLERRVNLREQPSYDFHLGRRDRVASADARFELRVGSRDPEAERGDDLRTPLLLQNSPNPFWTGTVIRFRVGTAARVEIEVFDLRGRVVKRLVSGSLDPGTHEVAWRGDDERGQLLPQGVYFYRLVMEGFRETRKMIRLPDAPSVDRTLGGD